MTYGERLKQWMTESGRSVRGLAGELSISHQLVHAYRSGRCLPPRATENAVALMSGGLVTVPRCETCRQRLKVSK